MSNKKAVGYATNSPYQCPQNFVRLPECEKCADKPVCLETFTIPAGTVIAGFTHTQWFSDDCVKAGDCIIRFGCGPIDTGADGFDPLTLKDAICAELMKHNIPECQRVDGEYPKTKILEVKIMMDIILNDDGSLTVSHEAKEFSWQN